MTLVVSDISKYGVVMVGDSALTRIQNNVKTYSGGCKKIHFSNKARIGFAIWGRANVGTQRIDRWINEFIKNNINEGDTVVAVGNALAERLNAELVLSNEPWNQLVRGIHIAGFNGNTPVLYHVHCGHDGEPPHELRLYRDYPDNIPMSFEEFFNAIETGDSTQLRNGKYKYFALLFKSLTDYSQGLRKLLNIELPQPDLRGRLEYYKLLVKFVAGVMRATGEGESVNDILSCIAFDRFGTIINETLPLEVDPNMDFSQQFLEF